MLHWQHKSRHKAYFCLHLFLFVFLFHLLLAVLFLLQSSIDIGDMHIIASRTYELGADIIVVPFKSVDKHGMLGEKSKCQKQDVAVQQTGIAHELKQEKKVEPVRPQKQKEIQEKQKKVVQVKKENKKKDEQLQQQNKQQTKQINQDNQQKKVSTTPQVKKQEIGTKQLQAMNIQRAIAQQVQIHWQPPTGFADNMQITLAITLNYNGEVADIDMVESSKVLACDIHARSVVYAMDFPKSCWGKKITITFKQ